MDSWVLYQDNIFVNASYDQVFFVQWCNWKIVWSLKLKFKEKYFTVRFIYFYFPSIKYCSEQRERLLLHFHFKTTAYEAHGIVLYLFFICLNISELKNWHSSTSCFRSEGKEQKTVDSKSLEYFILSSVSSHVFIMIVRNYQSVK